MILSAVNGNEPGGPPTPPGPSGMDLADFASIL